MATALKVVPSTSGVLGNYAVTPSADGGWNYSFNGNPITREAYAAAGGQVKADPVRTPTNAKAPGNPNGGGGTPFADKSNDIAAQLAYLGATDQKTAAGTAAIDKSLGALYGNYDTEAASNETNYRTNADQNTNNLQVNKQTALVNAAQGRQGLYGTLASIGALNGSGIDKANTAVANGANADLAGASSNYATNASALDTSIGTFRQQDKERRDMAARGAEDAKTNLANDVAKEQASLYSNLVGDYSAMGNSGQAKAYTDKITALAPKIAATSIPSTGLGYTAAAYTPATLSSYIAGADSTQVTATPTAGKGTPGLVATPLKKKTA
jgi:hypothetical protein